MNQSTTQEQILGMLAAHGGALPPVPRLALGVDVVEHIRAWVDSAALAALVGWFRGRVPPSDAPLVERLAELDAFSDRWDFRRQRERNEAPAPCFTDDDARVVVAAATALGLDDCAAPALDYYDEVIVLGGLARACLARPLAAASLLAAGTIRAGRVIALGGFRPLNQGERGLLDRMGLSGPEHELDVIDVGMRRAFSVAGQAKVRGDGDLGADDRWEVRTYLRPSGPTLDVVATPAPVPGRRANTADTCRWLAANGELRRGDSVLLVTTHHYRNYQLVDAVRELGEPLGMSLDAVGMTPGDYDERLVYRPSIDQYLQEVRSTIRSYRAMVVATSVDGPS